MNSAKIDLSNITISTKSEESLSQTQKSLGFIPNMYKDMAANDSTLESYSAVYNSFRKNSGFSSVEQEVILLSVAYANNCEYCVAAHSFVGDVMTNVPQEVTNAIRDGKTIPDAKLEALSVFTKLMVEKRAWLSQEDLDAFFKVGYGPVDVLGVITGIAVKTISNYSNHLFQPEVDSIFASRVWTKNE